MTFYASDFEKYIVTGFYYNSTKRFRRVWSGATYANAMAALSINLWRGKVYGIHRLTGKRVLLKSVTN